MTDIVIYTKPETLAHKKGGDGFESYYWKFRNSPKGFRVGSKIYFATKGFVRGYFVCSEFNPGQEETIVWKAKSWVDLPKSKQKPCKHCMGFRYKWW